MRIGPAAVRQPCLFKPITERTDMEPTYLAQYRGFEFRCSPERLGAHAFAPRLVIYDSSQAVTLEIPIAVPTPPFEHPTDAAHQAFAHGRRWVDDGYSAASQAAADEAPAPPEALPG
jgi:hypothetical protein